MKLYTEVWFPRAEEGGIGIEKVAAGGRPLQTTLNDKKQAMIHERIVEMITTVHKKVFMTLAPSKIVELFRLGDGSPPQARDQHRRGGGRLLLIPRLHHV